MGSTILAAALALTLGQPGSQAYTGTWVAELTGTPYVHVELTATAGALGGRISLGNIEVDSEGEVTKATSAPREMTPIFDIVMRDSVLSFSRKESEDTDRFEIRLLGDKAAELRFLLSEADRRELAEIGVPVPKPIRLKKVEASAVR